MEQGKLKQQFLNAAHVTLNAGGNALAWTPVGALVLANDLSNAWGNHDSMLTTIMRLDTQAALTFAGMLALGLAAAVTGYKHALGGEPAAAKSKTAHAFNFAASSVGAAAIALGVCGLVALRQETAGLQDMIAPALIALGGGVAFTVGHKRLLGTTLPALPSAPSPK